MRTPVDSNFLTLYKALPGGTISKHGLKFAFYFLFSVLISLSAQAERLAKLDQAISFKTVADIAPVFDFDGDGCLPAAGIGRDGRMNSGLKPTGNLGGSCRPSNFLDYSNTLHRHACVTSGGKQYCGHFYSLYFEKDQANVLGFGHRHDWEQAAIWTIDGRVTHGGVSAHGKMSTESASSLPFENGHLKVVYHKDGPSTHSLRFAKNNEQAENPAGRFVTPAIVSWFDVKGNLNNHEMRRRLNQYDYGDATIPLKDSNFYDNLNRFKPGGFPTFAPLNGTFKVRIRNEQSQEGVVASWGAHQGLVNGGNPLLLYSGSYETCRIYDCDLIIRPINGRTAPYKIEIRNERGQKGVIASWGAHQGIRNGSNPLQIYTGTYETCRIHDCDFVIESIPGRTDAFKISVRNERGEVGVVASWGAHQGIPNGSNPLLLYTGTYEMCRIFDCDFLIQPK